MRAPCHHKTRAVASAEQLERKHIEGSKMEEMQAMLMPDLRMSAELGIPAPCPPDTAAISQQLVQEKIQEGASKLTAPRVPEDIQKLVDNDDSYVQCPRCHNVWQDGGRGLHEDYTLLDKNGNLVTDKQAVTAFQEHRFRCRECALDFCRSCSVSPFHVGQTCEGHTSSSLLKSCRFCGEGIPGTRIVTAEDRDAARVALAAERVARDNIETLSLKERAGLLQKQLEGGDEPMQFPSSEDVCSSAECQEHSGSACTHVFPCGHFCPEDKQHQDCKGCMRPECVTKEQTSLADFCSVCWVDELGTAPIVRLECGHAFHRQCIEQRLLGKWGAGAVNLSFADCPLCGEDVAWKTRAGNFPALLSNVENMRMDIGQRTLNLIKMGEAGEKEVPVDMTRRQAAKWAMGKLLFFSCFQCHSFYYGGKVECGVAPLELPASEFVCNGCRGCPKHGKDDLLFKCKFCCSVASYFCFGHTHFCKGCHDKWNQLVGGDGYALLNEQANLATCTKESCPLGIAHPPNGETFLLGCKKCFDEEHPDNAILVREAAKKARALRDLRPDDDPLRFVLPLGDPLQADRRGHVFRPRRERRRGLVARRVGLMALAAAQPAPAAPDDPMAAIRGPHDRFIVPPPDADPLRALRRRLAGRR